MRIAVQIHLRAWAIGALSALLIGGGAAAADLWSVKKISGEVWLGKNAVQQASLTSGEGLRAGETIRTGRNGRVLLTRGEETILVSPNSEIALPAAAGGEGRTTILQRAGSIVLEVEKKNAPHFEVLTPYLAAVVKGTRFEVSISGRGARVNVLRGQVQVADFKSGQFALVLPGQAAAVRAGAAGLALSGSGTLGRIQQGQPRIPPVTRVPVPKGGFAGPPARREAVQERRAQRPQPSAPAAAVQQRRSARAAAPARANARLTHANERAVSGTRITRPLGEVRVNFEAATRGLARDGAAPATARSGKGKGSPWSVTDVKGAANSGNRAQNADLGVGTAASGRANGGMGGSAASAAGPGLGSVVSAAARASRGNNGNGADGANGNAFGKYKDKVAGKDNPGVGKDNPGVGKDNPGVGKDNPGVGKDNPGKGKDNPGKGKK